MASINTNKKLIRYRATMDIDSKGEPKWVVKKYRIEWRKWAVRAWCPEDQKGTKAVTLGYQNNGWEEKNLARFGFFKTQLPALAYAERELKRTLREALRFAAKKTEELRALKQAKKTYTK